MTEKTSDTGSAALTRRNFLEQFGLVGGSTLVMSAMRSWDLMAQAGPRPVLCRAGRTAPRSSSSAPASPGWPSHTSSASSDTTCASSRRAIASEASTGRCGAGRRTRSSVRAEKRRSATSTKGIYHNGGPWRLPHWHTGVLGYCKELGVPLEVFINENEAVVLLLRGRQHRAAGSQARPAARSEGRHDWLHVRADGQGDRSERARPAADRGGQRAVRHVPRQRGISRLRRSRVQENRRARPWRSARLPALLQSGFGNRIRSVIEGTGMAPMFQPVGGMDQFPKAFQRKLGDTITLGVEVVSIRQSTRGEGRLQEPQDRRDDGGHRRLLRVVPAADDTQPSRRQPVARDDGGREGHALQPEREDGAPDEAPVLGGRRQDLRRPPLLEPAVRRIFRIHRGATSATRASCSASTATGRCPGWSTCPSRTASSTC